MSAESFEKVGDFKIGVPKTLNSRRLRGGRKKILGGNLAIYFLLSMQKKLKKFKTLRVIHKRSEVTKTEPLLLGKLLYRQQELSSQPRPP